LRQNTNLQGRLASSPVPTERKVISNKKEEDTRRKLATRKDEDAERKLIYNKKEEESIVGQKKKKFHLQRRAALAAVESRCHIKSGFCALRKLRTRRKNRRQKV
jgi:hypothetical protein